MTAPFYPPGGNTGNVQQQAPVIVRGADGQMYQQTPQGLVPVTVQQQPSPGNPAQPQNSQGWQQPPAQAPMQQQQQQPQGPELKPDTVLRGPGIPQELQGRTLAEGMQLFGAMRQRFLQQQGQQPQNGQPPAPQQQQPNGNGQQQPQQPKQPMDARTFFNDPEGNTRRVVEETLRSTLQPMLAPLQQNTAMQQAQAARAEFLRQYPAAQAMLLQMEPLLANSTPEQLGQPQTWAAIYRYVLGESVLAREAQGYQPTPSQQQTPGPMFSHGNMNGQFFTEGSSPSPSAMGIQSGPDAVQLTPSELSLARASGMSPQQYAQSKADLAAGRMPGFGPNWGQGNGQGSNGGFGG